MLFGHLDCRIHYLRRTCTCFGITLGVGTALTLLRYGPHTSLGVPHAPAHPRILIYLRDSGFDIVEGSCWTL